MDAMKYHDLRDFLTLLEQQGELKRISLEWIPTWKLLKLPIAPCVPVGLRCCLRIRKAIQCRCCVTCLAHQACCDGDGTRRCLGATRSR